MPCIACVVDGRGLRCGRVEVHHLVDKGNRRASGGHSASIPLGAWHHRGLPPDVRMTLKRAEETYGPSLALSKRAFVERYGTERALLAKINEILNEGVRA